MEYDFFTLMERKANGKTIPVELWRRAGDDQWEYLSLDDWQWQPRGERISRRSPESLAPVSAERAAELEADRQSMCRYFVDGRLR